MQVGLLHLKYKQRGLGPISAELAHHGVMIEKCNILNLHIIWRKPAVDWGISYSYAGTAYSVQDPCWLHLKKSHNLNFSKSRGLKRV